MAKKVTFRATCPSCKHVLVLHRETGEVLSVHEPAGADDTGDPFEDALKKIGRSKETAEERFEGATKAALTTDENADQKFLDALEDAKNDPDQSRPLRDIDLG